jgi:hypothetical protein
MKEKIIEVKPVRDGWKVFEALGVEPVFPGSDGRNHAIDYAKTRQGFGKGEIRVLNAVGDVVETIQFNGREKAL